MQSICLKIYNFYLNVRVTRCFYFNLQTPEKQKTAVCLTLVKNRLAYFRILVRLFLALAHI